MEYEKIDRKRCWLPTIDTSKRIPIDLGWGNKKSRKDLFMMKVKWTEVKTTLSYLRERNARREQGLHNSTSKNLELLFLQ
jgi:hypothetical protein